jgi:hypothetical protein
MRSLIASLVVVGMSWGLVSDAEAAVKRAAPHVASVAIHTGHAPSLTADSSLQLARHWGPPRGCYPGGGWHHHHHHHHRPHGAYYRGGYGGRPWYPGPAYPGYYGGSGFGLYIGF